MKKRRIQFMFRNNYHQKRRLNIYFVLWTLIVIGSVYLLVRFALISFSEEIGQAKVSYPNAALYYISNKVMESGSSLVAYTMAEGEEAAPFPMHLLDYPFNLVNFVEGGSGRAVSAKENTIYDSYLAENRKTTANTYKNTGEDSETAPVMNNSTVSARGTGIAVYTLGEGILSREYILTNGVIYDEKAYAYFNEVKGNVDSAEGQLEMISAQGDLPAQEKDMHDTIEVSNPGNLVSYTMEQMKNTSFLVRNFYIVDPATKVTEELFNAEQLLGKDMTVKQKKDAPQILIYHTHSQETYSDSRTGKAEDTVVGVGSYLTQILEEKYGYQVIHDTTTYDIVHGVLDRNIAYNQARDGVSKILEENPGIEVIIDLHRDGADKRSTLLNGKETAQIMLFNGLSRDQNGPITYLDNPYLQDNLAFSLQLQLKGVDKYPGLFYKNYLHCWRYNMHLRAKSILMELGTNKNSLQSAMNAMEPFAEVLNAVLQGE